jgi:hypothetical protein
VPINAVIVDPAMKAPAGEKRGLDQQASTSGTVALGIQPEPMMSPEFGFSDRKDVTAATYTAVDAGEDVHARSRIFR